MGRPSFWLWFGHFYLSDAHLGHPADLACTFEVDLCGWSSTSSATDVWLRQNGASSKGPDSANQGEYYLYAVPSLDGEYHSISSPSFYSALEWQFKFGYYMFGSSGTLALQGWLQGSWATLWQEDGNQTDAWHTADVEIPAAVSSLQFRTLSSSMEIAIDAFESSESFIVLSGPCTASGGCTQSPNYPAEYGNSESCEIVAPAKPLYFTDFATEGGYDLLKINGEVYSGSSHPPQGVITSDIVQWMSDGIVSSNGWQICIVSGLTTFVIVSGPCTSTDYCVQSAVDPDTHPCEIITPPMPLYFLDFDTDWTDYLVVNGQMYTGNQAPPQGITTEMIGWTPSASAYGWPGYGWHACTMSGLPLEKAANARRKSKESNPTLLYIQAKDGGSPEVVETLPYIPTEDGGRHEVVETLPYIPTEEVQEHIGFPLVPGALADQDGHTNQEGFDLLQ